MKPLEETIQELEAVNAKLAKEQKEFNKSSDKAEKARKAGQDNKIEEFEAEMAEVQIRIDEILKEKDKIVQQNKKRKKLNKDVEDLDKELEVTQEKLDNFEVKMNNWSHVSQYDVQLGEEGSSPGVPIIQGPFTNWHPKRMMTIEDFCLLIDTTTDFIDRMKADKLCRKQVMTVFEMNDNERKVYEQRVDEYKEMYETTWMDIIKDEIKEDEINIVNFEYVKDKLKKTNNQENADQNQQTDSDNSDIIQEKP